MLCESRGGRPGLPVTNSPYDLCGNKATMKFNSVQAEFAAEIPTDLKGANDRLITPIIRLCNLFLNHLSHTGPSERYRH